MSDGWIKVALMDEIAEGATLQVEVGGNPVCLYNLGGTLYATQDVCTHAHASLAEGFIDGDCIECPLHQALFHIPTGKCTSPPAELQRRGTPATHPTAFANRPHCRSATTTTDDGGTAEPCR